MAWIIIVVTWAAVTALVGYPYVEKIQKVRNDGKRVFSYFVVAVAGWSILIAGFAEKVLKKTGVLEDEKEDIWHRYGDLVKIPKITFRDFYI